MSTPLMSQDAIRLQIAEGVAKTKQQYANMGLNPTDEQLVKDGAWMAQYFANLLQHNPAEFVYMANAFVRQCPVVYLFFEKAFPGKVAVAMGGDGIPVVYLTPADTTNNNAMQ